MKIRTPIGSALRFIALIAVAVMAGACGGSTENESREGLRAIQDDLGREIYLPERVDRAISLAPSITEMIFAAGAGDKLVGVTSYCNFPEEAMAISKIGDTQTPNIESIVALRPQVVLVSTASQLEAFTSVLGHRNIAVYVMDIRQIGEIPKGLRILGSFFGTEGEAGSAAADIEKRIGAVSKDIGGKKGASVFVQISRDPLITIGKDSYISDLVLRAGGDLVTRDVPGGYPTLSKETAFALRPEVIILSDSEDNREPNAVFASSPAVIQGRVLRIDADIISRPGPRLVDALEEIAAYLRSKDSETLTEK